MTGIAVVYLSRAINGKEPLDAFVRSYRLHPAGMKHDLVILMKGYVDADPTVKSLHLESLSGVAHQALDLPDTGFDIGSYRRAAQALSADSVLLLNSYSRFLADDWLAKMHGAFRDSTVGLAGATGNWESIYRNWTLAVPFAGWTHLRDKFKMAAWFPRYPNPHVRSNAFLVDRQRFLDLRIPDINVKEDSWRIESGRKSITRQIAAQGLRTVIVGADGTVYDPPQWSSAKIFRVGNQENLLIADNQTEQYATGDEKFRQYLSNLAWRGGG